MIEFDKASLYVYDCPEIIESAIKKYEALGNRGYFLIAGLVRKKASRRKIIDVIREVRMQKLRCHSCGKDLPTGTLKYVLEIKSFADFDGYLEEYKGDVSEGIAGLLEVIDGMDEKTLEKDVARDLMYILCKQCCDRFMDDPFQAERPLLKGVDVKGTLH